jgi:hypothetical protein
MEILKKVGGKNIQSVSEIGVEILASRRTCQLMKLFSIIFSKIRKSFPRFFAAKFLPNESIFCSNDNFGYFFYSDVTFLTRFRFYHNALTHRRVYILMANLFQILNQFVTLFRKKFK